MQNIIIPQLQGNVANPFDARIVLPFLIGEKDAVAPFQFAWFDVFALLDLRARVDV